MIQNCLNWLKIFISSADRITSGNVQLQRYLRARRNRRRGEEGRRDRETEREREREIEGESDRVNGFNVERLREIEGQVRCCFML